MCLYVLADWISVMNVYGSDKIICSLSFASVICILISDYIPNSHVLARLEIQHEACMNSWFVALNKLQNMT